MNLLVALMKRPVLTFTLGNKTDVIIYLINSLEKEKLANYH